MQRVFPALASTSNFLLGFFVAIGEDREDLYSVSRKYFYESLKCVQAWSSQVQQIDKKTSATVQKMEKKWWDNSEQEKKMEQYRIQRRNSRLLSASFELMIHSFIMCTYIKEVTDLGGVSKLLKMPSENQTKAEWSDFGLRVDSVFRAAQKSYMSCEDVLCSGGAEDLERPFGSSAASPTTEASASPDSKEKGKKTLSAEESFIKTKQTFRETLDNLLKDLDSTDDGKTEEKSSANKETKTKKSSFWSSKSTSLPQFFLNSIVNAWDAVRRGGEVKETPEYFAKNVLVFWWSIERYWDILLHQESEGASALLKSRKSPAVDTFLDSTVPLLERKQRKYYDGCSINTKSQWMSAIGYHDLVKYWRELFSQPLTEGDPARTEALVRRLIPTSLYLSYDRSNALVHSLVGTFSIIRDGFTPDAAHPFHAVLQSEYSPDRALYRSSAVALGWIHLHHCFTSTALSISQSPFINKSVTSRSLLYDPIGVQSSPGPLLSLVESVINTVSSERTVDVTTAKWGELTKHHLNLAEDYFHMVLDHDPANIGALCGLGRLHMLATGHSYQPKLPTVADAFTPGAGSKGSIVGRFPQLDVARTYFETVLRSPPPPCVSASMPATEHMLDPIYRSFSAYWLSEMHKPFSWEDGGVTVPHFQHSMGGESGGNIFDEAFRSFLVSEEYLEQSVRLYPHNNWGLTSLGLHCLHRSQWKGDTSKLPAGEAERFQAYLEEQRHQGFSLLKRSLFLNPRNIWTIWGLSVFSDAAAEREKHQLELRRVFHRNLRTMKW
ncbi:hypothetical protein ADEAN_000699300 [Angomonas deanei]|uniref:Uncharacterized protein n=1 Tax=Angomonas deanei TaxID=59799 RepID=A0A7G2CIA1_9TRYP|nr:hypothetical protein ADEAN_000699300 [Angomonas deanei]